MTNPTTDRAILTAKAITDERIRFEQAIRDYSIKILEGIAEAGRDPAGSSLGPLTTWAEVRENLDLRCWAVGFDVARAGFVDELDERAWGQAITVARHAYQSGLDALHREHDRLQDDAEFLTGHDAGGYYAEAWTEDAEGPRQARWYGPAQEVAEIATARRFPTPVLWS